MNTTQSRLGTKEALRTWLHAVKNLTYTAYCKLPVDKKLSIQGEYKKKLMSSRSTVIVSQ